MGNGRQTILDRLRKTFRIDYDDDCLDKWEGIELVTKSLDQQTESRIGMLLVNALLVFCITAGGMGIVLSAIDSDYQTWIVELVTFANKVWNASRFIMMHLGDNVITEPAKEDLEVIDRWILSAANHVAADVTENMEKYELGVAVQKIYDFVWTEFCDWYIELVKPRLFAKDENPASANAAFWTLKTVLIQSLKLLHPYMPFITEEIFCTLQSEEESIMISNWPVYRKEWEDEQSEAKAELMKNLIRGIRNIRTEMNVAPSRKAVVYLVADDEATGAALEELIPAYQHMISASEVHVQADKTGIEDNAVSVVIDKATAYMPLADLVDFAKEKERLTKEKKKLEGELKRVNGMLGNEKFMSKAPEAKVAEERAKLEKYTAMMAKVEEELKALEK